MPIIYVNVSDLPAASVVNTTDLIEVEQAGVNARATITQVIAAVLASPTFTGTVTVTDASNVVLGTTTGTQFGTAAAQKLGFHGATPAIQRAGAAQAAVVTTASTQTTPYGFSTQAQADSIVTLVNELRAALVEKGLLKGAA
jgi:hypothetical protein